MKDLKEALITWLTKERLPKQPMPATGAAVQITFRVCMTVMLATGAAMFFFSEARR